MSFDLLKIVKELDFERLAGTKNEANAATVITGYLDRMGLGYRLDPFELTTFETGIGTLEIGDLKLSLHPYGLCSDTEIEGELVYLENPDALRHCTGRFKDKILLTCGSTREMAKLLKGNGIKGFICTGTPFREAHSLSHRQCDFGKNIVPGATIKHDDALLLPELSGQPCRMVIQQASHAATAHNIVVELKGTQPDRHLTYLVGHYDTVSRSPGACDNSGGTAVILDLLRHFQAHPPKRDLTAVFFSGEELGLNGSRAYVKANEQEVKERGRLVVNVDVAGDALGQNAIYVLGSHELRGYSEGILREQGFFAKHSIDLYSSDGIPFSTLEVPSLNVARYGGMASSQGHTPNDRHEYITHRALKISSRTTSTLLDRILNAEFYPIDKKIDESLKEKIERYQWFMTNEEPKLQWTEKYRQ